MVAPYQNAYLRCEVYTPNNVSDNLVDGVIWYRSLDLITVTDEYKPSGISPFLLSANSGNLAGLFKVIYTLTIRNISSSDSGYYWCQIINNQTCLSPSPYVNISINTSLMTAEDMPPCSYIDYMKNPVCASIYSNCSQSSSYSRIASPTIHILNMTSSTALNNMSLKKLHHTSSIAVSSSPTARICMTEPNTAYPEFIACLGVTVPTAGFVLILIILFICCAGIYVCQRKRAKQKGKQKC